MSYLGDLFRSAFKPSDFIEAAEPVPPPPVPAPIPPRPDGALLTFDQWFAETHDGKTFEEVFGPMTVSMAAYAWLTRTVAAYSLYLAEVD